MRVVVLAVAAALGCGGPATLPVDGAVDDAGTEDGSLLVDASVDAPVAQTGYRIGGIARGIREPTQLIISAGPIQRRVWVTQDGSFTFPGRFADGATYAVTTNASPLDCGLLVAGGTIAGTHVTSIELTCYGVVELANISFTFPFLYRPLPPSFDPGTYLYTATRPFFMEPTDQVPVTPTAAYGSLPTITINSAAATSGSTNMVPLGAAGPVVTLQIASPPLSRTYTFAATAKIVQEAYVKASDPAASAEFGGAGTGVAISGHLLAVGAPGRNGAYAFQRDANGWAVKGALVTGAAGSRFGAAVATNGAQFAVGAPMEIVSSLTDAGSFYVFRWNGTAWVADPVVMRPTAQTAAKCGSSIALSGDTLVVGCLGETGGGAVYVFAWDGTSWTRQDRLTASNGAAGYEFGFAVAISGNTIVVGAPDERSNATGVATTASTNTTLASAGAAYVFLRTGTSWALQAYLKASNTNAFDEFGTAVSIDGDYVVVGAPGEASNGAGSPTDNSMPSAGAAYTFHRATSTWSFEEYLKAPSPSTSDNFGRAVAIDSVHLVIGAFDEDTAGLGVDQTINESAPGSGAVYAFRHTSTWLAIPRPFVKAFNTDNNDRFGNSVALDGDTFVVGAPGEDSNATGVGGDHLNNGIAAAGAVYVFR